MNDLELIRSLQKVAADEAGLKSVRELLAHDHEQRKAKFRDSVIFLARTKTDLALEQLGEMFGARHHTTILSAVRREKVRLQRKPLRKDKRTWVEWHEYLYNKATAVTEPIAILIPATPEKDPDNA
jgi:chromosomal replication initiation ATPase DnaA